MSHDFFSNEKLNAGLGDVVITEEQLFNRIRQLGDEITNDYNDKAPLLLGILKGAALFIADLSKSVRLPIELDFMAVSSYGNSTKTSGVVRIVKDLDIDITNRDVIVVEDIVDSGLTLNFLRKNLLARNPASLEICALIVKKDIQIERTKLKYVGFEVDPTFLVGYGLDVAERYRNLPYLAEYKHQA